MALGKISGPMLLTNLERQGIDLSIETNLFYVDVSNAKVGINSASPDKLLTVEGNARVDNVAIENDTISNVLGNGNVSIQSTGTGNVNLRNLWVDSNNIISAASGNIELGNPVVVENFFISANTITNTLANGNIELLPTGSGILKFTNLELDANNNFTAAANANITLITSGIGSVGFVGNYATILPAGNTSQRPSSPVTGMLRINSETFTIEFYDGGKWQSISDEIVLISSDKYVGDGNTNVYALTQSATTAGVIASLDGAVAIPGDDYNVAGNVLTFVSAPASNVTVELRSITTVDTTGSLASSDGLIQVVLEDNVGIKFYADDAIVSERWRIDIDGHFTPAIDNTYTIGNVTSGIGMLYFSNCAILETTLTTTATTPDQVIGTFAGADFSSAEFSIEGIDSTGSKYQKTKVMAIHNGSTAEFTEYGNITLTGTCGDFSVDYNSGNLRLLVTPNSANSTVFKSCCVMTLV